MKRCGFTIVEFMIIVAILGILLAIIIPNVMVSNNTPSSFSKNVKDSGKFTCNDHSYLKIEYQTTATIVHDPDCGKCNVEK